MDEAVIEPEPGRGGPVMMVSTQGGHLAHLLALRPWWSERDRLWVCPATPDVLDRLEGERLQPSYHPTTRNVPNLLRNTAQAVGVIRRFRPTVIVSTGAASAVPYFVLGRARGIRTVYIEVFDRIDSATLTGRLVRPVTDLMLVQWPEQTQLYDDSVEIGPLL